ncbi:MAG: rhomboid family intramembrane serine protease [Nitrospirota bacterium]|nr:rhomboid family intramembrane serine protease [Nitrospirota bacterium]
MIPYKDDNPIHIIPVVTILIISLNLLVFITQVMSGVDTQSIAYSFGAIPSSLISFETRQPIHPLLTVFTSMFMHGGLFHLCLNMLYFWIFGNNIEERLGHLRFVLFYFFCGCVAAFSHTLASPGSNIPMIGASGAVSGMLGAYLLLFPMAKVSTIVFLGFYVTVIKIPALIVIGFWAIIQVVSGLISQGTADQGGIAFFAHVGGFVAGLVTIKLWQPRRLNKW